jgi:hypothetical protein
MKGGLPMPFAHYGILSGTLTAHYRDDPQNFGRWRHVHLRVAAGGRTFEAAVDVDDHDASGGVQWKTVKMTSAQLGMTFPAAVGFTTLTPSPSSGALDNIRHPHLKLVGLMRLLRWAFPLTGGVPMKRRYFWVPFFRPWRSGNYLDATLALEDVLTHGTEICVWGEPYPDGSPDSAPVQGLHNVHQNQGDPFGSGSPTWWNEAGIWQDGGVAILDAAGKWHVFISKFATQSDHTDASGHPV